MNQQTYGERLEGRHLMAGDLVDLYTFGVEDWSPLFSNESAGVASVAELSDFNKDGIPDITAGAFWYEGPDMIQHPLRRLLPFQTDYMENNG